MFSIDVTYKINSRCYSVDEQMILMAIQLDGNCIPSISGEHVHERLRPKLLDYDWGSYG